MISTHLKKLFLVWLYLIYFFYCLYIVLVIKKIIPNNGLQFEKTLLLKN